MGAKLAIMIIWEHINTMSSKPLLSTIGKAVLPLATIAVLGLLLVNSSSPISILAGVAANTATPLGTSISSPTPVTSVLPAPVSTSQAVSVSQIKDWADTSKAVVEIIAIVVAGWWTYRLFVKNRVEYPYPKVEHSITHWPLADGTVYLSIIVTVTNAGNVLLPLVFGKVFVQQIRPMLNDLWALIRGAGSSALREGKVEGLFQEGGRQIAWRELGYRESTWGEGELEIEPGEREELQYDFILDEAVQTIRVISYLRNAKRGEPEVGWRLTTIYDLQEANHNETQEECV